MTAQQRLMADTDDQTDNYPSRYWRYNFYRSTRSVFQDGGRRHLEFLKTVMSLICEQSSPNFVEMLQLQFRTNLWRRRCIVTRIKDACCSQLGFWKTVLFSLLFDQSSPNVVEMLRIRFRTHLWRWRRIAKMTSGRRPFRTHFTTTKTHGRRWYSSTDRRQCRYSPRSRPKYEYLGADYEHS